MTINVIGQGGLGNQLFQLSAAKSLAVINKTNFQIEISRLFGNRPFQGHKFFSNFDYGYGVDQTLKNYYEPSYRFDPEFFNLKDGTNLNGYFQSWKYLEPIKKELREDLSIYKGNLSKNAESYLKTIDSNWDRSVAIHIRRGDYCDELHRNHHGLLPKSYYIEALSKIDSENPAIYLFIENVSEIPDWIFDLDFLYKITIIQTIDDAESLHLMSKCKYIITANSSFSWWAGYIGNKEELSGRVFAPKNYFKTNKVDTSDLHPDWFELIDNGWEG